MDGLREIGVDVWFNLGDRDLAIGIERARALRASVRLTDAHAAISTALGIRAKILPMSDQPVRTRVLAHGRSWEFQEFMIQGRGAGPVDDVEFRGAGAASATPEVLEAIVRARAIMIGPSNPIISIGPVLATPGVRDALAASPAPVVAVSPLVRGEVVKGPTQAFMEWAGRTLDSDGIADIYDGVIDGLVADQRTDRVPTLEADVLMDGPEARRRVAGEAMRFALGLA
jgi:LPPG:FO 2-phospho-L-lactate transferase